MEAIHEASALTHAHVRSQIACGLYFFMVRKILDGSGSLQSVLQRGLNAGFAYYANIRETAGELVGRCKEERMGGRTYRKKTIEKQVKK